MFLVLWVSFDRVFFFECVQIGLNWTWASGFAIVYGMIYFFTGLSALCSDIRGDRDNLPLYHHS